jgi:hypothetical protein
VLDLKRYSLALEVTRHVAVRGKKSQIGTRTDKIIPRAAPVAIKKIKPQMW